MNTFNPPDIFTVLRDGRNREREVFYKGNLMYYMKCFMKKATNKQGGYHDWKHISWLLRVAYSALGYLNVLGQVTTETSRALLIAIIYHDRNHNGHTGQDHINIPEALRVLEEEILEEDRHFLPLIKGIIERGTFYPYNVESDQLTFLERFMRDLDKCQAFDVDNLLTMIFGLADEMGDAAIKVLKMQEGFIGNIEWCSEPESDWFEQQFPTAFRIMIVEGVNDFIAELAANQVK